MSLNNLLKENKLKNLPFNQSEVDNIIKIIERDLHESENVTSLDWKLMIAYNAGLSLCNIILRFNDYKTTGIEHHKTTIIAAKLLETDKDFHSYCNFIDQIRRKRNNMTYIQTGLATDIETQQFIEKTKKIKEFIIKKIQT